MVDAFTLTKRSSNSGLPEEDLPVYWCSSDGELHVGVLRPVEVEMVLKKSIKRCSADQCSVVSIAECINHDQIDDLIA